ncbi:MAG: hypothetical protein IT472_05090 [Thermomonas sp.]|uniref:hypothetical protein n=1 Tax=Thermomonas sp. TaxID=1971895 RepID=UPI0026347267|nr:hypothetical protein [Thermomonas sp.]MCC7096532.1 hypothetical protein [Thermomonas sp.]
MIAKSTLCMTLALFAFTLAAPAPAAQPAPTTAQAEQPLITTSYLIAPERVGDFVLEKTTFDDKNKAAGAGFRYALPDYGQIRFDVFVYPTGRLPHDQAVDLGMPAFKSGVEAAQSNGLIKDLVFLADEPFPLQPPDAQPPASSATAARPADKPTDPMAEMLATIAHEFKPIGRRLRMRDTLVDARGDFPIYSNGYLFYRQLYYYKVRISAGRDLISEAEFDALADRAARTLVPAIEVINLGGCANKEIQVNPDAGSDTVAETLMRKLAQFESENCFADTQAAKLDEKSEHASVVTIHFNASDWKTE